MTKVSHGQQEYAVIKLDHGEVSTVVYRDAPFPESELDENKVVRTYQAGDWDWRCEPAAVASTYEEAVEAMAIHHGDFVAVPVEVAKAHWFKGARFASDPGVQEESA